MSNFEKNRGFWDGYSTAYQERHRATLANDPLAWGVWRIPEAEIGVLGDLAGLRVLELGCGAAQWTCALRSGGFDVVGMDLSAGQLRHARSHALECSTPVPLVQGDAHDLPFGDATFDVVFCDHGAMTFASPERAVRETSRVLRDGGLFAFCMSTPIRDICSDPVTGAFTGHLETDYFTLGPLDDGESVTAQLPYGAWIRLFRRESLRVEDLVELRAPDAPSTTYTDFVPAAWASRWPAEHIWKVRRESRQVGHQT
jgi:SAM-dependent methyltransferase